MLNMVALEGRLTKESELKKTQQNVSYLGFTLAVSRRFRRDNQPEADFISCVAWRQSADFLYQYCRKGDLISVSGSIATRKYERDGHTVYVTEVICDSVNILAHKQNNTQSVQGYQDSSEPSTDSDDALPEGDQDADLSSDDFPFY